MDGTGQKVRKRGYSGARLELIKKAASLSLEEYTIPEIARELKISDSKVRRLLAASDGLPASCLTDTAQVARLLDLHRLDGVLSVAFPVALGRGSANEQQSDARDKTSLKECWEAMRIVLDVIKQRAKLLRYEVPAQDQGATAEFSGPPPKNRLESSLITSVPFPEASDLIKQRSKYMF